MKVVEEDKKKYIIEVVVNENYERLLQRKECPRCKGKLSPKDKKCVKCGLKIKE